MVPTQPDLQPLFSALKFPIHVFQLSLRFLPKTIHLNAFKPGCGGGGSEVFRRQVQPTFATSTLLTFHGIERQARDTWERGSWTASRLGALEGGGAFFFWYISLPYITRWCSYPRFQGGVWLPWWLLALGASRGPRWVPGPDACIASWVLCRESSTARKNTWPSAGRCPPRERKRKKKKKYHGTKNKAINCWICLLV